MLTTTAYTYECCKKGDLPLWNWWSVAVPLCCKAYWGMPPVISSTGQITIEWLLGSFWTQSAQCCWRGVASPKKPYSTVALQQFISCTEVSIPYCNSYIIFRVRRNSFTLPSVAPFEGPQRILSPLQWTSIHLHCCRTTQGFMPVLPTSYPSNDRPDMQQQGDWSVFLWWEQQLCAFVKLDQVLIMQAEPVTAFIWLSRKDILLIKLLIWSTVQCMR